MLPREHTCSLAAGGGAGGKPAGRPSQLCGGLSTTTGRAGEKAPHSRESGGLPRVQHVDLSLSFCTTCVVRLRLIEPEHKLSTGDSSVLWTQLPWGRRPQLLSRVPVPGPGATAGLTPSSEVRCRPLVPESPRPHPAAPGRVAPSTGATPETVWTAPPCSLPSSRAPEPVKCWPHVRASMLPPFNRLTPGMRRTPLLIYMPYAWGLIGASL